LVDGGRNLKGVPPASLFNETRTRGYSQIRLPAPALGISRVVVVPATLGVNRTRTVELPAAAAWSIQPIAAIPAAPTSPLEVPTFATAPAGKTSAVTFARSKTPSG
jgi:hypothetical protein